VSDNTRATGAAAVTVVLWASAFVSIRSAGGHFSPGALALGRLLVASLALGVMWLASGDGWPPRAAWPGIGGSGVLWFGLYMITLNWGEREVDAGTAAMVVTIGPILIALLGGWLLREGFPRRLGAGMAVSLAGAIVVGVAESGGGRTSVIGVVLCVAAAVCYAAGVVFQKPALGHASAVQVTAFGCFAGTVACLPFAGQLVSQLGSAPVGDTLNVVYLGLFPTMLGFTTWPTHWRGRLRGRWAPPRTRSQGWSSSCRGWSLARCPGGLPSPAEHCAWPASRSPAPGPSGGLRPLRRSP
jgi:drug/metabolite transporter (DMT)-like permease